MATEEERRAANELARLETVTALGKKNGKEIDKWGKQKLKEAKENYSRVPAAIFEGYKSLLAQYVEALKAAQPGYQAAGSARKEQIVRQLLSRDRQPLANAIAAMDTWRTAHPKAPKSTENKKPNWWKRIVIGAALIGAAWFTGKQIWPDDKPENDGKSAVEQTVEDPETAELEKAVKKSALRKRLAMNEADIQAQITRIQKLRDQGRLSVAEADAEMQRLAQRVAQGDAETGYYIRSRGQDLTRGEYRLQRDAAGTRRFIQEQGEVAQRSRNATARDTAQTGRVIRQQGLKTLQDQNAAVRDASSTGRQIRRDTYQW